MSQILTSLVRQRQSLEASLKQLEELKDSLTTEIVQLMLSEGLTKVAGLGIHGYQLVTTNTQEYPDEAYQYAARNQIIDLFLPPAPKPSITRSKVLDLHKACKLTDAQMKRLQSLGGPVVAKHVLKSYQDKTDANG